MSSQQENSKEGMICWVDNLTFGSLWKLILLHRKKPVKEVHYLEINPAVEKFIKSFGFKLFRVVPIEIQNKFFQFCKKLEVMHALPASAMKGGAHFTESLGQFLRILDGRYDEKKIVSYFDYALAEELRIFLLLIHEMPSFYQNDQKFLQSRCIVLIRDTYWVKHLRSAYCDHFNDLQTYGNLKNFILVWCQTLKIALELCINSLIKFFKGDKSLPSLGTEGFSSKIAVLYAHGADLTKKCDYYWLPHSGINPQDVIVYFKHHICVPSPQEADLLAENNISSVDLLPWRLNLRPLLPISLELNIFPSTKFIGDLKDVLKLNWECMKVYLNQRNKGLLWFWSRGIHLLDDGHFFESFFDHCRVKIHYSNYETGRHMFAANLGMDRLGGVDLCHHWSNYDFVDLDIGKPHDVYLTWGSHFQRLFDQSFFPVKYFVLTGYPYDYLFDYYGHLAKERRDLLKEAGARTVISFFDQGLTSYHSRWNDLQEKLYQFLLKEVITNTNFGLVIKSKKATGPRGLTKKFPSIKLLIEQAKASGRCMILEGDRVPCEASLASDLAVGVGVSSTPSVEAALAGVKAITFNAKQSVNHPMYAEGRNRVIFDDYAQLTEVLKNYDKSRSSPEFGDYSFMLNDVDPFRDGQSRQRVGRYIRALQDSFLKGRLKAQVLQEANEIYQTSYGLDKVIENLTVQTPSQRKEAPVEGMICWVDSLNFISLTKLILLHRRNKIKEVHYLQSTPEVKKFIQRFEKRLFPIFQIQLKDKYVQTVKVIEMFNSLTRENSPHGPCYSHCLNRFLQGLKGRYDEQKLSFYFNQMMSQELYTPLTVFHELNLYYQKNQKFLTEDCLVLIKDTYWATQLNAFFSENFKKLHTYTNIRNFILIWSHTVKIALEVIINSILFLIKGKRNPLPSTGKDCKIAVLHAHGADLNKKCDYYWVPQSGINPQDVIVYFKHHDRPPTTGATSQLQENKVNWIDLLPWWINLKPLLPVSAEFNIFPSRKFITDLINLFGLNWHCFKMYLREKDSGMLWFWSRGIHMLDDMHLFESFFKYHQVKIHYANYEGGRHMVAANMAIDRLGGVDVCHHWSIYDMIDVYIAKLQDVYFLWGPYFKDVLDQPYYQVKYFVYTGFIYDYLFDVHKPEAEKLRQRLSQNGARTVVSLFDQELMDYPSRWNTSQENLYHFLLQEVINNNQFGLLIKPKKESLNKKFPGLSTLIEKAKATGRCMIFDGSRLPCEATLASDLAIGVGVVSTPSWEAALMGKKGIVFNADQWEDHPMYKEGHNRVIFNDFNQLTRLIKDFEINRVSSDFGDYSFILNETDPFRDGRARERVSHYIRTLQKCFLEGCTKQEALDAANEAYRASFGSDKVVERSAVIKEDHVLEVRS